MIKKTVIMSLFLASSAIFSSIEKQNLQSRFHELKNRVIYLKQNWNAWHASIMKNHPELVNALADSEMARFSQNLCNKISTLEQHQVAVQQSFESNEILMIQKKINEFKETVDAFQADFTGLKKAFALML